MAGRLIGLTGLMLAAAPAIALAQSDPAPPAKGKTVEAITVTGAAPDVQVSIDKKSYTLGKDLQATTGSIADALRNVPAVEVDLQGSLSLRGDSNVTILVDGKPSPAFEGPGRADALQQLPADQFERVEVITNPSAALNPEGTGGVINLITRTSRGAGASGSTYATVASAGLKRSGLNLGYNSRTLAITAALAGNYQRNKGHTLDERDGLDPTSGQFLRNLDGGVGRNLTRGPTARLNVTWTATPRDQLTGAASYGEQLVVGHPDDRYTDDGPAGAPVLVFDHPGRRRYLQTDHSLSAGWKHAFGEGHELSVDAVYNNALSRDHTLYATLPIVPATPVPLELIRGDFTPHHAELRVAYAQSLGGGSLKTGYEVRREDNDADFVDAKGPSAASLVPVAALANHYLYEQLVNAVYVTYQRSFGRLNTQLGLRLEDVRFSFDQLTSGERDGQHYDKAYPTVHLAYALDAARRLSASYSVRVQRPPTGFLNPLVYILGPQDAQMGNPDLKPKETRSLELGYEQRAGVQAYQATVYYRQTDHDFSQVLSDLGGGRFETSFGNLGSSRAVGVDLTANGMLSSTLRYSLSFSPYWNQIDAGNLGALVGTRSTVSAGGRANLDWQARPADMVQVNLVATGERLQAQGVLQPTFTLNLGWRHKFGDRLTATMTAQDLLASSRFRRDLETSILVEHLDVRPAARAAFFRLDYRFGGGQAARDPGFEYDAPT